MFLKESCYDTQTEYINACYCTRSAAVWAAARASALPFKRRAKTNRCGCRESACGGIVGHWDVFFAAGGIHKKQNAVVVAATVCATRWRFAAASEIRYQKRHRRRTRFRCSHNDFSCFVLSI